MQYLEHLEYLEHLNMADNEGPVAAAGFAKPIIMPDIYRGDVDEDWQDWLDHFKSCAEINGWDNPTKCKFMSVRLKDTAHRVFKDLDDAAKTDWDTLCSTLEKRFKTTKQPQFYKTKFLASRQNPGESPLELGNKIRTLARKAYPTMEAGLRDELARDQFVRSLNNVNMTLKLRHDMPESLDDAIRMAIDWETVEIDVRSDKESMTSNAKEESKKAEACSASSQEASLMSMMSEMLSILKDDREEARRTRKPSFASRGRGKGGFENDYRCYLCGSDQHLKRNCPRNRGCWNCGQQGHIRNDCPGVKQPNQGNK